MTGQQQKRQRVKRPVSYMTGPDPTTIIPTTNPYVQKGLNGWDGGSGVVGVGGGYQQPSMQQPQQPQQQMPQQTINVPAELISHIAKTGQELELVVQHLARQEEEIKKLRETQRDSEQQLKDFGQKMHDAITNGFQSATEGADGKGLDDLKALEQRLKDDLKAVIHQQVGSDAKRLQITVSERLGASMERSVGTELSKAFRNKAVVVAIGRVVAEGVSSNVASGCKSEFANSIVPTFKQSVTNLFTQLNNVFQKGIKEYLTHLERKANKVVGNNAENCKILGGISKETREMAQMHLQHMSKNMQNQLEYQVQNMAKRLQDTVNGTIRTSVTSEVSKMASQVRRQLLQQQKSSALQPGGANSPSDPTNSPDAFSPLQRQINSFVLNKDYNSAFQVALNACDLDLLSFMLNKVEPRTLFSRSSEQLTQPILLSLLHQLGAANLSDHTEIKLKYIDETLNAIDETSPEVKIHFPEIVKEVQDQIAEFKDGGDGAHGVVINRLLKKIQVTCQSYSSAFVNDSKAAVQDALKGVTS